MSGRELDLLSTIDIPGDDLEAGNSVSESRTQATTRFPALNFPRRPTFRLPPLPEETPYKKRQSLANWSNPHVA